MNAAACDGSVKEPVLDELLGLGNEFIADSFRPSGLNCSEQRKKDEKGRAKESRSFLPCAPTAFVGEQFIFDEHPLFISH